jgi:YVTN family beta-propeller protein
MLCALLAAQVLGAVAADAATEPKFFKVGSAPEALAISPDGARAYVVNALSDSVSVIDTQTNKRAQPEIGVGFGPAAIAIAPDGSRAYVANGIEDTVAVLNLR